MANPQHKPGSNGFKSEWSAGEILEWLVLLRKIRFALRTGNTHAEMGMSTGAVIAMVTEWAFDKVGVPKKVRRAAMTVWYSDRKRRIRHGNGGAEHYA